MEAIAALPGLLLAGLLIFQLVATGYTAILIDGAAEAGAIARASGLPAGPAVRAALPGWARERVSVRGVGDQVEVTVRPPSPIGALSERLRLSSTAAIASGP